MASTDRIDTTACVGLVWCTQRPSRIWIWEATQHELPATHKTRSGHRECCPHGTHAAREYQGSMEGICVLDDL
jgi:hypothetical protein